MKRWILPLFAVGAFGAAVLALLLLLLLPRLLASATPQPTLIARFTEVPLDATPLGLPTVPPSFTPDGAVAEVGGITPGDGNGSNVSRNNPTQDLSGVDGINLVATVTPSVTPTLINTIASEPTATQGISLGSTPTWTATPAGSPLPATPTPIPVPASATPTFAPPTNTPTLPTATPTVRVSNPKKGIGSAHNWLVEDDYVPFDIGWYYTWSLFPNNWENVPNLEFIPMWPCYGTVDYVTYSLGVDYDGYVLWLNEPDREDQCPHSVDSAAQYYITVRNALPNAKFIGPHTIMRGGAGNFTGFVGAWRERVRELTGSYPDVHGYGIHIYPYYTASGTPEEVLTAWCNALRSWGELGTKELWVTEFGFHNFEGTPQQVRNNVTNAVNLFENGIGDCQVARYAYFTDRWEPIDLDNPTPTIAPVGRAYFDLYWRNSFQLSYTGQAYRDAGR